MILSNYDIAYYLNTGEITIYPYNKTNVSTSSYDVTLGENFYAFSGKKHWVDGDFYNIYSEEETSKYWGEPRKAVLAKDYKKWFHDFSNISEDDKIIFIDPGETILAHTNEFIGGRGHITTMMKARSSLGRQGIAVCKCAGWGDVGYVNRWTMEITNFSKYTVPLIVGRRIAQIVFMKTGHVVGDTYEDDGKYSNSDNLDELIKNWTPDSMLPKLYKDSKKGLQI